MPSPGNQGQQRAVVARQADADVAVEQAVAVAVLGDQQQAAGKPGGRAAEAAAGQLRLDPRIEPACALRAFAQGGEQAQAVGLAQGIDRIGGMGKRAPMAKQRGAVRGQRVVGVFVKGDPAELAAAQQVERVAGVAAAHRVGKRGQLQRVALAVAADQVDAGGGEGRGAGHGNGAG